MIYTSFDDVPLDDPGTEGDDSVHSVDAGKGYMQLPKYILKNSQSALVVPHPRDLHKGMRGGDVTALKRALINEQNAKRGILLTSGFGGALEKNLKVFQKKKNLIPDGVYGRATHTKLAPYYDHYGVYLINHTVIAEPFQAMVLSAAMAAYNNRYKIHYTQSAARMYLVRNHVRDPKELYHLSSIYEDCSSFATWIYYQGNRPDPNGFGYNGLGFTGTLAAHGVFVPTSTAKIGDLHFYGRYYPYHHVTINVGNGRCISHGSEVGPVLTSVWYRGDLNQTRRYV